MGDVLDLDKLAVGIRPRQPWEAIDLGFLMAKRWWWPLTRLWLIISAPLFIALAVLPTEWLWLQYMVVWWLKPIFERAQLDFLRRSVFGEYPSTRVLLKDFSRLAFKQIFLSLTWRRLSPSRSFDLPVMQLEGLSGTRRHERLTVLHRQGVGPAASTTMFGASIEFFLAVAVASIVFAFMPQEVELSWTLFAGEQGNYWAVLIINTLTYIAMTLVAPFYVAGGFSLYLNRRIHLEAWDIEIAFKKMVQKREKVAPVASLLGAVVLVCALTSGVPVPAQADVPALTKEQSQTLIDEVKKRDEFNQRETISERTFDWSWWDAYINEKDDEDEEDVEQADTVLLDSLRSFFGGVASVGEWILWLLVLVLVVFIALRYGHWLRHLIGLAPELLPEKSAPRVLFGMEVHKDSLPANVSDHAAQLWREGEARQALSLLYRGCLMQLIQRGSPLRDGDTEGRCLEKAELAAEERLLSAPALDYFRQLTQLWQALAYAHQLPDEARALKMCQQWNAVWLEAQAEAEHA